MADVGVIFRVGYRISPNVVAYVLCEASHKKLNKAQVYWPKNGQNNGLQPIFERPSSTHVCTHWCTSSVCTDPGQKTSTYNISHIDISV